MSLLSPVRSEIVPFLIHSTLMQKATCPGYLFHLSTHNSNVNQSKYQESKKSKSKNQNYKKIRTGKGRIEQTISHDSGFVAVPEDGSASATFGETGWQPKPDPVGHFVPPPNLCENERRSRESRRGKGIREGKEKTASYLFRLTWYQTRSGLIR